MSNLDDEELIATRILNGVDKSKTAREFIKLKRKAEYINKLIDSRIALHEEAKKEFAKKYMLSADANSSASFFTLEWAEQTTIDELNFIKKRINVLDIIYKK